MQKNSAAKHTRLKINGLLAELEHAFSTNNAKAAAHSLLELGRTRWPDDPPGNLGTLASRLGQNGEDILVLDRALYDAAETSTWDGARLWVAVKDNWHKGSKDTNPVKESLQPLYPHSI